MKIGLTVANLIALGDLFKDIEKLQISVTGLARTLAPTCRNLLESQSVSVCLGVQYLSKSQVNIFFGGSKSKFLVRPK